MTCTTHSRGICKGKTSGYITQEHWWVCIDYKWTTCTDNRMSDSDCEYNYCLIHVYCVNVDVCAFIIRKWLHSLPSCWVIRVKKLNRI